MFQQTGLLLATCLICSTSRINVHNAVPPILFPRLAQAGPRLARAEIMMYVGVGHPSLPVAAGASLPNFVARHSRHLVEPELQRISTPLRKRRAAQRLHLMILCQCRLEANSNAPRLILPAQSIVSLKHDPTRLSKHSVLQFSAFSVGERH